MPWIITFVILWVVVLLLSFLTLGLFRRISHVLEQAEMRLTLPVGTGFSPGLQPGSQVPPFRALDATGASLEGPDLSNGGVVYLFLGADCAPCDALLEDLRERGMPSSEARVVAVIDDTPEGHRLDVPEGMVRVYQRDHGVSGAFQTMATPHAFAVDETGVVVEVAVPNTVDDLHRVVQSLEPSTRRVAGREVAKPVIAN